MSLGQNQSAIDGLSYILRMERARCRGDLLYLCHLIGFKDVSREVHGPILDTLTDFSCNNTDKEDGFEVDKPVYTNGKTLYHPNVPLWELPDKTRNRLILYPRGHLKTSIITIAHAIQWIINYPNIRILISTAIGDQATAVLKAIKSIFQFNHRFRELFPEFCPDAHRAADFGTQDSFTIPCRGFRWLKEPTVSVCTIGKVIAGGHYELIIHSDLVDKENVRVPSQIQVVKDHFGYTNPLLERGHIAPYHGWIIVEGTRYDFSDLYGMIIDSEASKKEKDWKILVRGAVEDGKAIWPQRFPLEELENIRKNPAVGDRLYSANYLNNPIGVGEGLATQDEITWIPGNIVSQLIPRMRIHTTIDLHGMEANNTNDFTVLTTCGFDREGRCYVLDIRRARFNPLEVIREVFEVQRRYRPIDFKIEKDAHARVLLPFLRREMEKRAVYPVVVEIKRDTHTSKQHRIWGLQPWFQSRILRFSDAIGCRLDLIHEITRFPRYMHDDILDTLADQMQNRDGGVTYDVIPDGLEMKIPSERPPERFLGFNPLTGAQEWSRDNIQQGYWYNPRTGAL